MKPFFLALTLISLTTAQDSSAVHDMESLVVTGSRTEKSLTETAASITVIDKETIANSAAKNIDDLLAETPSLQVKRVVGIGEGIPSDIIIRGIPGALLGTRTLVLIDGLPSNASGTPFMILNELPLSLIKSVEVVRGPYSSLYGANAFSGVINIRTVEGNSGITVTPSLETSLPFTLANNYSNGDGDLNRAAEETFWDGGFVVQGGTGLFRSVLSAGYRTIGDYQLADSTFVRNGDRTYYKPNENYDYHDLRLMSKSSLVLNDLLSFSLQGRLFKSELGFGRTRNLADTIDVTTDGFKWVVSPSVTVTPSDNVQSRTSFFYRGLEGSFVNEDPDSNRYVPSLWESTLNDWQLENQTTLSIGDHQVTAGADLLQNSITFGKRINRTTNTPIPGTESRSERVTNSGVYIQDEWSIIQSLQLVPSFRFDYHSQFGSALSPKASLLYSPLKTVQIRTSTGRAFRAPSLSELYMPETRINSTVTILPNQSLTPEYIWSSDFSVTLSPFNWLSFTPGIFYNSMNDLIEQTVNADDLSNPYVTHANKSSAWARGLELSTHIAPLKGLSINLNGVWQATKNSDASEVAVQFGSEDSISLDYIPTLSSTESISYKKEVGTITLWGTATHSYVGNRSYQDWNSVSLTDPSQVAIAIKSDGSVAVEINPPVVELPYYNRLDLALGCTFPFGFNLKLAVQNVTDASIEESGGTHAPGRFASLTLSGDIRATQ